ncbi:retrovirus-related pol polyprotein from transposon TNT 1-94 [Tanacetum coccineum]
MLNRHNNRLVQDQTVLGKDYSNLLIADSLLKTIWFINAPCYGNKALPSPKANELTIPEQTATSKGTSNPLMAGSLPKTTKPTYRRACGVGVGGGTEGGWSKFVTDVKLVKDLHTTNVDQLHAYLQQHERHENEVRLMHELVPVFQKGDDPIDAINHMISFLTVVVTSRYPTTNNQLRTSSNPRQQATIYDGKVTVQPVQGRQTTYAAGTIRKYTPGASGSNTGKQRTVICYNCKWEGHIAKQCTNPKRKRDETWFNDKVLLVQAQAGGQGLTEEEIAILADPGLPDIQTSQIVITHNAAYQADDLDTYDSDCDELNSAKIALMANLYRNGLDALTELLNLDNLNYDLYNQSEQIMPSSEQSSDVRNCPES